MKRDEIETKYNIDYALNSTSEDVKKRMTNILEKHDEVTAEEKKELKDIVESVCNMYETIGRINLQNVLIGEYIDSPRNKNRGFF